MKVVKQLRARKPARKATPQRRSERTRERILEAAHVEFSQKGLGGARVDEIARRASANKRMIYHYFGSKEDLFLAVLEHAYLTLRRHDSSLHVHDLDPEEGMRELVDYTFSFMVENREFISLLNSENLYCARHIKRSTRIRDMYSPLIDIIGGLLRRGEQSGAFRKGVDPLHLYISIAGLTYFYFSNIHTLSAIFAVDLDDRATIKAHRRHVVELVLGFLRDGRGGGPVAG